MAFKRRGGSSPYFYNILFNCSIVLLAIDKDFINISETFSISSIFISSNSNGLIDKVILLFIRSNLISDKFSFNSLISNFIISPLTLTMFIP